MKRITNVNLSEGTVAGPRTWKEFEWPYWVPEALRTQIQEFWADDWHRGPDAWLECASRAEQNDDAPKFGDLVGMPALCGEPRELVYGRYVHAWNNIGRVVHSRKLFGYTSVHPGWRERCLAPHATLAKETI